MSAEQRATHDSGPVNSGDLPPHKMIARAALFVVRYSKLLSIVFAGLATVSGVLWATVQKADAHEVILRSHEQRIERLENLTTATYINAMLACRASGAVGCITEDRLRRGEVPNLQLKVDDQP